ncbi:bifunctional diguanylate cyclase/phosphodiesterase [Pleomorphomonas diazotrophica]|uniref:Bifunctional diguanylate cyclase/phosphodiesterase n=1 Tax=Pleomorphomonas diazotrophica TaxID=1166257 RepID=A0A1I4RSI9_9HYPH|nr:EAL domain-containing protein [Pleomorphomonas diazotrophica]PKR88082.1 bifunctional diguanylate cyclase/phosphodiesterase [Pleomorphomonas diazotrophica]SFM55195.1 diguanylate cyclase (GGDEF) domain-containing protein [Pleomorphomonas diazotrophica]
MFFANRRWMEFVFGVVVPTMLTAIAAAAVVNLAMARMATEVNDIDRQGIGRVVEVLKDEALARMSLAVSEFAAWNGTALDEVNAAQVGDELHLPAGSNHVFDTLLIVDAEGAPIRAYHKGRAAGIDAIGISRTDVAVLVAEARQHPHLPASGFVQSRLGPLMAGLRETEPRTGDVSAGAPHFLLVGRPMTGTEFMAIAKALGVKHLTFGPAPVEADAVPLVSAAGALLGFIGWDPRVSGTEAMERARLPVLAVLLLLFVVMGVLVVTIWKMMSGLRHDETAARHAASHDPLSGLPNRASFNQRLAAAYASPGQPIAVLFADLDGFKEVNDTYGHDVGDRLIRAAAAGFRTLVGGEAVLARLGGDEFAVVIEGAQAVARARALGESFVDFLDEAFDFDGRPVKVGCSVGVAGDIEGKLTPGELVRRADVAMYVAKAGGKNRVDLYDAGMDADRQARATLAAELREAVANDVLQVHYQPVVSARTGGILAVEALVRWIRPAGPVSPAVFLAVAEEAGMSDLIGTYVLRRVARDAKGFGDLKMVVNVFAAQFRNPGFPDMLGTILKAAGMAPERLEIDITESFLASEPERARCSVEALHALGVSVALDDFGTGFSSVAYLRRFAFDKVKIDRSVVIDVIRDPASQSLVQAAVALAETLGAEVTAEGIEMAEEAEALKRAGCHELQGYYFGAPTVRSEILRRISRERQAAEQLLA